MLGGLGIPEIAGLLAIACLWAAGIAWVVWVTVSIARLNRAARQKGP